MKIKQFEMVVTGTKVLKKEKRKKKLILSF